MKRIFLAVKLSRSGLSCRLRIVCGMHTRTSLSCSLPKRSFINSDVGRQRSRVRCSRGLCVDGWCGPGVECPWAMLGGRDGWLKGETKSTNSRSFLPTLRTPKREWDRIGRGRWKQWQSTSCIIVLGFSKRVINSSGWLGARWNAGQLLRNSFVHRLSCMMDPVRHRRQNYRAV